MDDPAGTSGESANEAPEVMDDQEPSSSNSNDNELSNSEDESRESSPSPVKKQVFRANINRVIDNDTGHRVDLSDANSIAAVDSLYEKSKNECSSKLPTTQEGYHDLVETLLNPARMEGRELTMNAYDYVRPKYHVLPDSEMAEADMQKIVSNLSCDICPEIVQTALMTKKCGHRFCDQCISVTLMRSGNTCPKCRMNLGSKRELQQDPRFDQLSSQIVESRSLVPRMMSKHREHERDVYFGRHGYIEGGDRWADIDDGGYGKFDKYPMKRKSVQKTLEWFPEEDEDGTVPEMINPELYQNTETDVVTVIDNSAPTAGPSTPLSDIVKKSEQDVEQVESNEVRASSSKDNMSELVENDEVEGSSHSSEVILVTSNPKTNTDDCANDMKTETRVDSPLLENVLDVDKNATLKTGDHDKDQNGEEEEGEDEELDEQDDEEALEPSSGVSNNSHGSSDDIDDEEKSQSGSGSDIDDEEDSPDEFETELAKMKRKHEMMSDSDKDSEEDEHRKARRRKRTKYSKPKSSSSSGTEDSDESSDSSDDDMNNAHDAPKLEFSQHKKKKKGMSGRPKKVSSRAAEGDITTPSEDSLTSSGEESEESDAFAHVHEEGFNKDPRKEKHPDKKKIFNFDFKFDMDGIVNRRYEKDGETNIASDDSNSENEEKSSDDEEEYPVDSESTNFKKTISSYMKRPPVSVFHDNQDAIAHSPKEMDDHPVTSEQDEKIERTDKGSRDIRDGTDSIEAKQLDSASLEINFSMKANCTDEKEEESTDDNLSEENVEVDDSTKDHVECMTNSSGKMFEGFFIREGDTGTERPTAQRHMSLDEDPLNLNPDNVFVIFPPPATSDDFESSDLLDDGEVTSSDATSKNPRSFHQFNNKMEKLGAHSAESTQKRRVKTLPKVTKICQKYQGSLSNLDDEEEWCERTILNEELISTQGSLVLKEPTANHKCFYDSYKSPRSSKPDIHGQKFGSELTMEEVTRMTEQHVVDEETKIHRKRLAINSAIDAAVKDYQFQVEETESEESDQEDYEMDDMELENDEVIVDEEESKDVLEEDASEVHASDLPMKMEVEEVPLDELLFDPNQPCSSNQAAERSDRLARIQEEQQVIEDSIQQNQKSLTPQPSTVETEQTVEPVLEEPVKEVVPSEVAQVIGTIEEQVEEQVDEQMEELAEEQAEELSVEKELEEVTSTMEIGQELNPDDVPVEKKIKKTFMSRFEEESDFSEKTINLTQRHHRSDKLEEFVMPSLENYMSQADANLLKPTIADYASSEFLKFVSRQPVTVSDEAIVMSFCAMDTTKDFESYIETGKKLETNPDELKLKELVMKNRQKYAVLQKRRVPRRLPVNMERILIERARMTKYKHIVETDRFDMKIHIALQKQQIAASRANLQQPSNVAPEEHAAQVQLLQNLQNPQILHRLLRNPLFALTLAQAQQQAIQQQRAQQKAQAQRELAARKAEQARVEELARRRIAQEDAEKAEQELKAKMEADRISQPPAVESLPDEQKVDLDEVPKDVPEHFVVGKQETLVLETPPTSSQDEPNIDTQPESKVNGTSTEMLIHPDKQMELPMLTPASTVSSVSSGLKRPSRPSSATVTTSTPIVKHRTRLASDGCLQDESRENLNVKLPRSHSQSTLECIRGLEDEKHSETIIAGNVTHVVDTTILEEEDISQRHFDFSGNETSHLEYSDSDREEAATHYVEKTINLEETLEDAGITDEERQLKQKQEDEMNREIMNYTNRYHHESIAALEHHMRSNHNKELQELLASKELQAIIDNHNAEAEQVATGETTEAVEKKEEEGVEDVEDVEDEEEPELQVDRLGLSKIILKQRQGIDVIDDSESDEDYDANAPATFKPKRPSHKQREPRQKSNLFVPNIPLKIRRRYVDQKIALERVKYRDRIKAQKMASIRISFPQKPAAQQQFATPKAPIRVKPNAPPPRATPKPKKPKLQNVQMSIVQPPLPLHQLQSHMNVPTKITAVPNMSAGYHQQLQQQQVYMDMAQVPQSTPIRTVSQGTPTPQTPSHLAQLGQFVHASNQNQPQVTPQAQRHQVAQANQASLAAQNAKAAQVAQMAQAARMAQAAQAARAAQIAQSSQATGQMRNPQTSQPVQGQNTAQKTALGPQVSSNSAAAAGQMMHPHMAMNQAQMMEERQRQIEEQNRIIRLMTARGQYPAQNQELFYAHYAQAQADLQAEARMQAQIEERNRIQRAQMESIEKQRREALARQKVEEAARAKAQAEAEARLRAEHEMRARQAQAAQAQAQAYAHAQAQAQAQVQAQAYAAMQAAGAPILKMIGDLKAANPDVVIDQATMAMLQQKLQQVQQAQQIHHAHQLQQMQHIQQMQHMQQMQQLQQLQMSQPYPAHLQQGQVKQEGLPGQFGIAPAAQPMPGYGGMSLQDLQAAYTRAQSAALVNAPDSAQQAAASAASDPSRQVLNPYAGLVPQQVQQPKLVPPVSISQPGASQPTSSLPSTSNYSQLAGFPGLSQLQSAALAGQMNQQFYPQVSISQAATVAAGLVPTPTPKPPSVAPAQPAPITQQFNRPDTAETSGQVSSSSDRVNDKVELELWPTNGYADKKRQQGTVTHSIYCASSGDSTFYHVAGFVRNKLTSNADDIGSLWVLRLEDQAIMQFQLRQTLKEAQSFVGKQHLIIFYDDVMSGESQQSKEYIINKDFKPINRQH